MNQGFANNSLFIGDLSKFCTESNLESLFSQYGPVVDVKIKRNNTTGKTLSYGFVTFANDECATAALENLNGYSFFGRNLRIRWAVHNAKAQKAPEESVINSVYVRFITPKITEYITEEDFHRVFDPFGSILDCSIKESSIDQRTNRQSGYGFVHFTTDHAGIAAAFQAVSALDNATVHGVTYNVELSKNLLKQFNEMKMQEANGGVGGVVGGGMMPAPSHHGHHHRNMSDGSMGSLSSLGSHGSQPGIPGPPMPQYGAHPHASPQQQRWVPNNPYTDGPRGYAAPLPVPPSPAQFAQQQNMYSSQTHHQQRGGAVRANNGYMAQGPMPPMANNGMMYNNNMTYSNPYNNAYGGGAHGHAQPGHGSGNLDYLLNSSQHALGQHGQPHPGHMPVPGQAQGPYSQYRTGGPNVPPHQQAGMQQPQQHVPPQYQVRQQQGQPLYGIPGEDTFAQDSSIVSNRPGAYLAAANLTVNTSGPQNLTSGPGSNKSHSPAGSVHTTHSLANSLDHHSLGSGADSAPFLAAAAPPPLSPVPGRNARTADVLLSATGGGSGGNSVHSHTHSHAHSGYATSLAGSVDDESLLSHSQAAYSPYRTASPVFENSVFENSFDIGLNLNGVAKPPPLNLMGLGMHSTGFSTTPTGLHSSANSVHSGSLHCGSMANSSGGNSPIPTDRVRGGLNERLQTMKLAPSPYGTWDDSGHVHVRAESTSKPPTPAANRAVGTATQAQTAQGRGGGGYSGSTTTSQNSTPTSTSGKSLGISIPGTSPKSSGIIGSLPLGSNPGIGGISASLPPPASARSGIMSRSSSTSSASAGAGSLLSSSGSVSPPPYRHHSPTPSSGLSSTVNSARRPTGLSDLDIAINRSISSSTSDRNILSTHNTTDGEGGFFNSSNSSMADTYAQAPRREQLSAAGQTLQSHSSLEHAELTAQMLADHTSSPHGRPLGGRLSAPLGQVYLRAQETKQDPYAVAYPEHLHADMKQSSLQSVSSIGEGEETDFHDDELVYSTGVSPHKQPSGASSDSNFTIDTAFMLSPQNSAHSLDGSPFASYTNDSFRGRPPSGGTVVSPLTASNLQAGNALATALLRRSYSGGDAVSTATDDGEVELGPDGKPQPRPLSLSSTESSQLAGIAIDSSTSSDADYQNAVEQVRERSLRPEKMRLDRNSGAFSAGCAVAASLSPDPVTPVTPTAAEAEIGAAKPKQSRQLSLTQFFKPAQAAAERTALPASK